jgi:hypothetical protein
MSTGKVHIDTTNQASQANEQSAKTRQVGQVNVPALAANIYAAATKCTNIHNNTGDMHQCLNPERTTDILHK